MLLITLFSDEYRYAFNGMEYDDEIQSGKNSYTTEFRQYDPRLGRWKSLDPLMGMFPSVSPYEAFGNNPIFYTDPYGLAPTNSDGDPPPAQELEEVEVVGKSKPSEGKSGGFLSWLVTANASTIANIKFGYSYVKSTLQSIDNKVQGNTVWSTQAGVGGGDKSGLLQNGIMYTSSSSNPDGAAIKLGEGKGVEEDNSGILPGSILLGSKKAVGSKYYYGGRQSGFANKTLLKNFGVTAKYKSFRYKSNKVTEALDSYGDGKKVLGSAGEIVTMGGKVESVVKTALNTIENKPVLTNSNSEQIKKVNIDNQKTYMVKQKHITDAGTNQYIKTYYSDGTSTIFMFGKGVVGGSQFIKSISQTITYSKTIYRYSSDKPKRYK